MKPAMTSVVRTAVASRMRRRRFHRFRCGSKNICLSGMVCLVPTRKPRERSTLYITNRMEAAQESQSTGPDQPRKQSSGGLRSRASILLALIAGGVLRIWMLRDFFQVNGDSLIYGGLAKNLLLHGRFALTVGTGEMYPTLIRLPGYPLFLAVCFRLFGMENYASAAWVQIALELAGCLLLADFARHIAPQGHKEQAGHCTLWLAALCPFTAIYAACPLSETPTL